MLEIKCASKPSLTTSEVLQRNARVKTEARLRKDGKQYASVKPVKRQLTQRLRVQRLPRTNKPCLSHLQVPIYILSASHHFRDLKPSPNLNTCEYCDSKPLPHFKTSEYTVDYGAREAGCRPDNFSNDSNPYHKLHKCHFLNLYSQVHILYNSYELYVQKNKN